MQWFAFYGLFCTLICHCIQVQKSVDSKFKTAIERYRDDVDLQNAIDAVQENVCIGRDALLLRVTFLQNSNSSSVKNRTNSCVVGNNN